MKNIITFLALSILLLSCTNPAQDKAEKMAEAYMQENYFDKSKDEVKITPKGFSALKKVSVSKENLHYEKLKDTIHRYTQINTHYNEMLEKAKDEQDIQLYSGILETIKEELQSSNKKLEELKAIVSNETGINGWIMSYKFKALSLETGETANCEASFYFDEDVSKIIEHIIVSDKW